MSATAEMRQNPFSVSMDSISTAATTPSGMSGRLRTRDTAATTSIDHGARYIPTVDTSFAVVNWVADTGRLIKNESVCNFLSLMRFDIGSMHPSTINPVKNNVAP